VYFVYDFNNNNNAGNAAVHNAVLSKLNDDFHDKLAVIF